jgi:hypothetical protein
MESFHTPQTGAHWSHEPFDLGIDEAMPSNCRFTESEPGRVLAPCQKGLNL